MLLLNLELSERPRHGAICTAKERELACLALGEFAARRVAIATPHRASGDEPGRSHLIIQLS